MKAAVPFFNGHRRCAQALASLVAFGALVPCAASSAPAEDKGLAVSATVAKRASLKVLAQPGSVLVTEADLARGYIEVLSPVHVAVESNSTAGYLLVFESQGDLVNGTLVSGLGNDIQLGSNGVVPRPPPGVGAGRTTHTLVFRFTLAASAPVGRHAWPVHISVMPM